MPPFSGPLPSRKRSRCRLFAFQRVNRNEPSRIAPFFPRRRIRRYRSACSLATREATLIEAGGLPVSGYVERMLESCASCRHALRVRDNREIARRQWRLVFAYVFRGQEQCPGWSIPLETRLSSRSGSKTNVQPVRS